VPGLAIVPVDSATATLLERLGGLQAP